MRPHISRSLQAGVLVLVTCLIVAVSPARSGLVAHWKLDEGTGTSTVADSAGGHTGTMNNFEEADWVTAPASLPPVPDGTTAALSFDGVDEDIIATGYKGITGSTPRTLSAWIKTTTATSANSKPPLLSWGTTPAGTKMTWRVYAEGPVVMRLEVCGGGTNGTTVINDGFWHHVAAVLPAGKNKVEDLLLYVDGSNDPTTGGNAQTIDTASGADLMIGTSHLGAHFPGQMDDIRLYDRGMSAVEIEALYSGIQTYEQLVLSDVPITYWRLGEASGITAVNNASAGTTLPSTKDGTYTGGVSLGRPSLLCYQTDTAARFDGVDDYVAIPDHADINHPNPFPEKSIDLWLRTSDTDARQVVYEQGGGNNGINVYLEDGKLYVGVWNYYSTGTAHWLNTPIEPNSTYHVALVLDGSQTTLTGYLNGVAFDSLTHASLSQLDSHGGDVAIGAMCDGSRFYDSGNSVGVAESGIGRYFAGIIDEVATYNSALSGNQIMAHYLAGVPEPSSIVLLALGLAGLFAWRRRKFRGHNTNFS